MQRDLEERLGKRLNELDATVRRSRADGRLVLESLRDVGSGLRRLEAKLDLLAASLPAAAAAAAASESETTRSCDPAPSESSSSAQRHADDASDGAKRNRLDEGLLPLTAEGGGPDARQKTPARRVGRAGNRDARNAEMLVASARPSAPTGVAARASGGGRPPIDWKRGSVRDLGMSLQSLGAVGLEDSHATMAVDTRKVKHSFLVQFMQDEESEAVKAASNTALQLQSQWARGLEAVFGICEPDPKQGKEGSRVIHPQSNFATGAQDRRVLSLPPLAYRCHCFRSLCPGPVLGCGGFCFAHM